MKKLIILVTAVALLIGCTSLAYAVDEFTYDVPQDSHKVRNKYDFIGTFVSSRPWGSVIPSGSTWNYEVHIKEAMNGERSVGVVKFMSGSVEVIGHVKATKTNYEYWNYSGDPYDTAENLAAVGWTEYDGVKYNFMFLYSEGAIWIALSNNTYDVEWADSTVWGGSLRVYDLLSQIIPDEYPFDEKAIHE